MPRTARAAATEVGEREADETHPTKRASWPTARTKLPRILPASSWVTGIDVAMISAMRDCFSSATLIASVIPNIIALK